MDKCNFDIILDSTPDSNQNESNGTGEDEVKLMENLEMNDTANSNQPVPTSAWEISTGLAAVAESTAKTANRLHSHPEEIKGIADTMATLGRQLGNLTQSASTVADTSESLRQTVGEAKNTAEQIFPTGGCPGGNTAFNSLWNQYGN